VEGEVGLKAGPDEEESKKSTCQGYGELLLAAVAGNQLMNQDCCFHIIRW